MNGFRCPNCGECITDETIEAAMTYAHDCGFDEGYETAIEEREAEENKTCDQRG